MAIHTETGRGSRRSTNSNASSATETSGEESTVAAVGVVGAVGTVGETPMVQTEQSPARAARIARRLLRGLARVVLALVALIAGLAGAGAGYEALAARGDAEAYPAPGRLVDVGGYMLHINCTGDAGDAGDAGPTVVLDAGLSRTSLDWSLVQPEIARTNRVCAYDRAGMGWSDPAPGDALRTPGRIARELHALLRAADIAGPYVLVGHSLAGKNVRMFALQYPGEVAGMVLVDARGEYVDRHSSAADEQAFREGMSAQGNAYRLARTFGLARIFGPGQEGSPAMSELTRTEMALFTTSQQDVSTTMSEGLERAADDDVLHASTLGDMPLIVLASGQNMEHLAYWPESQRLMSALSTNGRLIVVEGSGHSIHVERPEIAVDAVQQVLSRIGSAGR